LAEKPPANRVAKIQQPAQRGARTGKRDEPSYFNTRRECTGNPKNHPSTMFPTEITTERLLLRPPIEADAERVFTRYCQDPEVSRYMSWGPHRSIDDTRGYLLSVVSDVVAGTSVSYLIFSRQSNELLGSVGGKLTPPTIQWGYCLARDAWGQGFATEAARAFVAAAIEQPSIWRLQAFCDLENSRSARVLEKSGSKLEGILRRYMVMPNLGDAPRDMYCYAKVRDA
jgi:[ribosomal protein S5]-alanine N-acetyltransferase